MSLISEKVFPVIRKKASNKLSKRVYAVLVIVNLLFSISLVSYAHAEVAGPGWHMVEAPPVSPEEAEAYYTSDQARIGSRGLAFSIASATSVTSEIAELARALRYDPKLIYDYVHNYIDYVSYYGSLKGATLTFLDGSGNDFDQASLMIALFRESSNYNPDIGTVQYRYGNMTIPYDQLANWLGVDNDSQIIGDVIASGGIPVTLDDTTAEIKRVWVKASIDGTDYLFDPAFKSYQYTSKIDIGNATGYNQGELLTAAQAGANVGTDFVQNLNESNIGNKLEEYSTNLINTIRSQYPNSEVKEIIGGRSIIQTNLTQYLTTLPFPTSGSTVWDDIPTSSLYTAKLTVKHLNCGSGIDINQTFNIPDLAGKRLTITYAGSDFHPELRLDGDLIDAGASTTQGNKCQLDIRMNHPYPAYSYNYGDQIATYWIESGRTYAIVYNFGGISEMLLQKRQQQLDSYLAQGLSDTSEEVLGETLNVMGLTWLKELQMTDRLLSSIAETVSIHHHVVGLMAQEAGYYIDVKVSVVSIISRHDIISDKKAHFKVWALIASALEHGILEQLMGSDNPGISTMKLFQIANTGGSKVFYADDTNFSTIQSQLQNYSQSTLDKLQDYIEDNGYSGILPENGQLGMGNWQGVGYIIKKISDTSMSIGMIIGGGYYGGYVANPVPVSPPTVNNIVFNQVFTSYNPVMTHMNSTPVIINLSKEPVDMASGAYLYEHTDLSLGGNAPLGLVFSRSYNSNLNLEEKMLGYGWTHNYDIYFSRTSHGAPGLGSRQPVDASALIAKLYAAVDLLKNDDTDHLLKWMVSSLASKWAVDLLTDNAVTAHLGIKLMEFIKLPDGTYSPPPGVTTQLIDNGDNTFSLRERFGTQLDFDTNDRASLLTDIDGNTMNFTYTGGNLTTVQDAFNRTLTLDYTDGRVSSVSDSAGRSISYGYDTDGDLTTYTDPESKEWSYGYDDSNHPHRMTSLTNPLTITTATNTYDSLGRVKIQTVPRQSGSATYNFYFSGFRNMEEDPDGYTIIYFYDEKGRPVGEENQLGHKSYKEYDGQFHIVKDIDPRTNETRFQYDGNQNLTKIINALSKEANNIYDSQFRLTDTIDPLNHGNRFEYDTEHHLTLSKACSYSGTTCIPVIAGDGKEIKSSAAYYANGLTETSTDARLTTTTFTFDTYGNPYTTKVDSHPVVTTVYNSIGLMTSLTDQVDAVTNFPLYNNRGQLRKKTDPLLKDTIMEYDDAGRLDYIIDRNNDTIDFTYTATGKVETILYPGAATVNFIYNDHDDLTMMQDTMGNTSYTYYADHSLETVTDPHGFQIAYTYDEAGNLTELTYPGSKKVIYTYDVLNRLETVTIDWLNPKPVATYHYDNAGLLDYVDNFNGTVTDYTYDNANRLTDLENKKSDQTIISEYHFTLDGNGNRTQVDQNEPLLPVINEETSNYTYNTERNRLQTAGASGFAYDLEGQLSTKDLHSFTFDYDHRLKTVSGANNYQYAYDGSSKRLKAIRDSVETRYIYDAAGNLLAEANSSNVIMKYYIHGAGLMAMVKDTNEVYTYHYDSVGNTIAMTDETEIIVNSYAYTPFGILANENESVVQPFKFVGKYGVMTEPNGFYYMRARYYDTEVGRFISEDPIGFDGGDVNLYAYVGNNPILYIDPDGKLAFLPLLYAAALRAVPIAIQAARFPAVRAAAVRVWQAVGAASVRVGQAAVWVGQAIGAAAVRRTGNPQVVQHAADVIGGFVPWIPSQKPSYGALIGPGARRATDNLSNSSGTCRKCN